MPITRRFQPVVTRFSNFFLKRSFVSSSRFGFFISVFPRSLPFFFLVFSLPGSTVLPFTVIFVPESFRRRDTKSLNGFLWADHLCHASFYPLHANFQRCSRVSAWNSPATFDPRARDSTRSNRVLCFYLLKRVHSLSPVWFSFIDFFVFIVLFCKLIRFTLRKIAYANAKNNGD